MIMPKFNLNNSADCLNNFIISQFRLGIELFKKINESFDRINQVLKGTGLLTTII